MTIIVRTNEGDVAIIVSAPSHSTEGKAGPIRRPLDGSVVPGRGERPGPHEESGPAPEGPSNWTIRDSPPSSPPRVSIAPRGSSGAPSGRFVGEDPGSNETLVHHEPAPVTDEFARLSGPVQLLTILAGAAFVLVVIVPLLLVVLVDLALEKSSSTWRPFGAEPNILFQRRARHVVHVATAHGRGRK